MDEQTENNQTGRWNQAMTEDQNTLTVSQWLCGKSIRQWTDMESWPSANDNDLN